MDKTSLEVKESPCFGMDLGTSNCQVARLCENEEGRFEVNCLTDSEGNESFPSVVHFSSADSYLVGERAVQKLDETPESTIEFIKIRLGKEIAIPISLKEDRLSLTPQEISACLLRHFNQLHSDSIQKAVLTVPAFFDQNQKDATKQAGILANIDIVEMIEEPTAAVMYHIFNEYHKEKRNLITGKQEYNILVFDFGGGTLDLSLVAIELDKLGNVAPRVLGIGGDNTLGGNLIDFIFVRKVIEYLAYQYQQDSFIKRVEQEYEFFYQNYIDNQKLGFSDGAGQAEKQFILQLKRILEKVKIELSTKTKTVIRFGDSRYREIQITRQDFNEQVLQDEDFNIRIRISAALKDLIKRIKRQYIVNQVLLVGGSSQIPLIRDIIIAEFARMGINERNIISADDYDKAVAKGAAILGAISDGKAVPPFMLNRCRSIVARDIVVVHSGKSQKLVEMGSEYPFENKKEFYLRIGHALSDEIVLTFKEITRTYDEIVEEKTICDFVFYHPLYYTGDEIKISLQIDNAGLYQIEAIHVPTNERVEYEPKRKFSLDDNSLVQAMGRVNAMKNVSEG